MVSWFGRVAWRTLAAIAVVVRGLHQHGCTFNEAWRKKEKEIDGKITFRGRKDG